MPQTTASSPSSPSSPSTTSAAGAGAGMRSDLVTPHGKTSIADSVVEKIAGLAARQVRGVHSLGGGASRALGALRERLPGTSGAGQGVSVEVGERQAAVDLDVVVEYGVPIDDLAGRIRRKVIGAVEPMTGLHVTEVNINVDDIHLPDEDGGSEPSRVE